MDFIPPTRTDSLVATLRMNRSYHRTVLECASPQALLESWIIESARGLAHSKTLTRRRSAGGRTRPDQNHKAVQITSV